MKALVIEREKPLGFTRHHSNCSLRESSNIYVSIKNKPREYTIYLCRAFEHLASPLKVIIEQGNETEMEDSNQSGPIQSKQSKYSSRPSPCKDPAS